MRILREKNLLVNNDEGDFDYIAYDGNLELSNGLDNKIAISDNFLCLCSYMNKVTGLPSYTVLTSDDTFRVLPENENE